MTQEGFVSLMLENDDSYMFQPMENTIKQASDDEFYRELSKQFYAPQRLKCFSLKLKKPVKSTNSQFIQKKFNSHLDAESIRLSALNSSNLKKEQSSKPDHTKQNLQQNNVKSIPKVRNPDFQNPYLRPNLKINPSQRQLLMNGVKPVLRLRLEDSQQYFEFSQNSHRSLLNTSTKSTNKSEKSTDLYFPIKLHDKKEDLRNLFKLSFRCKQ